MKELDANELITGVINTFALKVERYNGKIESDLTATDPIIFADEMHITNVIFNLMDNAVKYKRPDVDLQLMVKTWNEPGKLMISVQDNGIGIKKENLRMRDHSKEELCFYSNATTDIEYNFPFGFGELWGIASRTDYDLKQHTKFSGENLSYLDPETNERYVPYVIEPSLGVERLFLTILSDAYTKEELENGEVREVLKIHPFLAPYKVCILPLIKKNHSSKAMEVYKNLCSHFPVSYDESGNIGKRYRRSDAIGTPFAITIDDNTINDNTVTVRDRDTMKQEVVNIDDLVNYIEEKIKF